jgi:Xaa-Pro aminopeptidase
MDTPASTVVTGRLAALQAEVAATPNLDGWLLYDFRCLNPLAPKLLGLPEGAHLTRRWFCWVPREGRPALVHSVIEAGTWRALASGWDIDLLPFLDHEELDGRLRGILRAGTTVAMEYSPNGAVPYVSRVDGGTLERIRGYGVTVVSSANILQRFLRWTDAMIAGHREAVEGVVAAKDAAFRLIHDRLQAGEPVDELTVQAAISRVVEERGLITDVPAIVAFAGHAADPHFSPNSADNAVLQPGDCVMIDLWAQKPGCPYADITWMGCAGHPSEELQRVWAAVRDGRDAALDLLATQGYQGLEGWQVDRAAREVIERAGYGHAFAHRLGHDLGLIATHGDGANLDDLETHDTRRLTAGLGTSVEPGIYLPDRSIGVRSEVNIYFEPSANVVTVTTPVQRELYILGL